MNLAPSEAFAVPQKGRAERRRQKRPDGSGSLKLRGRIWWIRYMHNGQQVDESTKQSNEKVAGEMLREKLRTADMPNHVTARTQRVTFDDVAAVLLAEARKKQLAKQKGAESMRRALRAKERKVEQLREAFGGPWLAINTARVNAYQAGRAEAGEKLATTNRRLAELRHMGRLAMRQTPPLVTSAPYVSLPDESANIREGFIDPADFKALLAEFAKLDPAVGDGTEFAYSSAWRYAMVWNATWDHCELEHDDEGGIMSARIRLPGTALKNGRALAIPLTGRLLDIIRRRWALKRGPYIFHRDGKRIRDFRKTWEKATAAVGLTLTFHDLRRSAARNLRRAEVPEAVIMRIGGWRTRAMFDRYNITDDRDVAAAFDDVAAFMAKREQVKPLAAARAKRAAAVS